MGGFLAKPAVFYPHLFDPNGFFGRNPYFLPNLVAAICIVLAIIQGALFLKETNPALKEKDEEPETAPITERTPLHGGRNRRARDLARSSISTHASFRERSSSVLAAIREVRKRPSFMEESLPIEQRFDLRRTSFGTMHSIRLPHHANSPRVLPAHRAPPPTRPPQKTFNYTVVMLTIALLIISYHQMAFISAVPVYMLDTPQTPFGTVDLQGGLGFSLHDVGGYLAVNGFIALTVQALIFPVFVENVGVWHSFVVMIVLYPTVYIVMPFISLLPEYLVGMGIYGAFILQALYGIIVFPCALILLKNATPSPLVLGRVNGLCMSACCLARTVASPLVGLVYGVGGSAVAWWSLAVVAAAGAVQIFWVPRGDVDEAGLEVRSVIGGSVVGDDWHEQAIWEDD
jgi:hypothetical protein